MFIEDCAKRRQAVRQVAFLVMISSPFLTVHLISPAVACSASARPQPRPPQTRRQVRRSVSKPPRIDYSQFSHVTHVTTRKLACDSCHKFPTKNWKEVRTGDAAFPDVAEFPEHASCLDCHREQFFARERPAPVICSNCHVNVTPRNTARYVFPSLGNTSDGSKLHPNGASDFAIYFHHDKHADVIGLFAPEFGPGLKPDFMHARFSQREELSPKQDSEPKNCAVCHQTYQPQGRSDDEYVTKPPRDLGDGFWLKKGTFETLPTTHAACFTCHSTESELPPLPSDCNACHKLPVPEEKVRIDADGSLAKSMAISDVPILRAWLKRDSAATFRHEVHPDLSCITCHKTAKMNTLEANTLKVPVQSCGSGEGCHVTATTDDGGILNFEVDERRAKPGFQCVKCHLRFGKEPVPASHLQAILALQKK